MSAIMAQHVKPNTVSMRAWSCKRQSSLLVKRLSHLFNLINDGGTTPQGNRICMQASRSCKPDTHESSLPLVKNLSHQLNLQDEKNTICRLAFCISRYESKEEKNEFLIFRCYFKIIRLKIQAVQSQQQKCEVKSVMTGGCIAKV